MVKLGSVDISSVLIPPRLGQEWLISSCCEPSGWDRPDTDVMLSVGKFTGKLIMFIL